jgi:hypothetical protein
MIVHFNQGHFEISNPNKKLLLFNSFEYLTQKTLYIVCSRLNNLILILKTFVGTIGTIDQDK